MEGTMYSRLPTTSHRQNARGSRWLVARGQRVTPTQRMRRARFREIQRARRRMCGKKATGEVGMGEAREISMRGTASDGGEAHVLARNVKMTHETGHGVRRVRGRVRLSIFGIYRSLQPQSSLDPRPSVVRSSLPFSQRSASATHPHDSVRLNVLHPTDSLRLARPFDDPRPLLAP